MQARCDSVKRSGIKIRYDICAAKFDGTHIRCLSSCMTFLDLTEGDKLAFLVMGLHVGPMRSGIKIRYLLCAAKFEGAPIRRSL